MKAFVGILLLAALTGCATGPTPDQVAFNDYILIYKPRAERGEIPWSKYYSGLYNKARMANADGQQLAYMNQASGAAMRYEAGEITKDHFEYEIRAIKASASTAADAANAQARVEADRRSQLAVSQMAAGMAMMQASQPQPQPVLMYQPPRPAPGNAYVTGYLRNQSTSGTMKYCNYSNGAVITVASHQLCPQSTN